GCRAGRDRLLVLAARRAQMDVRVDECGREDAAGRLDDVVTVRVEPLADRRDDAAVDADVEYGLDPFDRIEHARAADHDVRLRPIRGEQHQATAAEPATRTGPV